MSINRPAKTKFRLKSTEGGKVLHIAVVFVFLSSLLIPAFGILCTLLAIQVAALLTGLYLRPNISVTSEVPEHIIVGETTQFRYTVKNTSKRRLYHLILILDGLPASMVETSQGTVIDQLNPGESCSVVIHVRAEQRGFYTLPGPNCYSTFPFNLYSFTVVTQHQAKLFVLPQFDYIDMSNTVAVSSGYYTETGVSRASSSSLEYVGNRPYMAGDSLRNIDSRAWARLASPVVKEYHSGFNRHAAIILDMSDTSENPITPKCFEAAVSLCASIAYSFKDDCAITMLVLGNQRHDLTPLLPESRVRRIHELLATASSQVPAFDPSAVFDTSFQQLSNLFVIQTVGQETTSWLTTLIMQQQCTATFIAISGDSGNVTPPSSNSIGALHTLPAERILLKEVKRL
jgi:uncharacterized protein (DUF58 family)